MFTISRLQTPTEAILERCCRPKNRSGRGRFVRNRSARKIPQYKRASSSTNTRSSIASSTSSASATTKPTIVNRLRVLVGLKPKAQRPLTMDEKWAAMEKANKKRFGEYYRPTPRVEFVLVKEEKEEKEARNPLALLIRPFLGRTQSEPSTSSPVYLGGAPMTRQTNSEGGRPVARPMYVVRNSVMTTFKFERDQVPVKKLTPPALKKKIRDLKW